MTRFYVAKVVKPDGRRSKPLTLFAENEEDARSKVAASGFGHGHQTIHVADVHPGHQGEYDRWLDDGNAIVEHSDYSFSDNGPISVYQLFQKK